MEIAGTENGKFWNWKVACELRGLAIVILIIKIGHRNMLSSVLIHKLSNKVGPVLFFSPTIIMNKLGQLYSFYTTNVSCN